MNARLDLAVPELDVAAPGRVPILVEIDQDVQPAVELAVCDVVEVDVDVEVAPRPGLVDAAADELVVGQEAWQVEDVTKQAEEFWGCKRPIQLRDRLGKLRRISDLDLTAR